MSSLAETNNLQLSWNLHSHALMNTISSEKMTRSNQSAPATNGQPKKRLVLNAFVEMCMLCPGTIESLIRYILTTFRLRPPISWPVETPGRSINRIQLRQALDQPRKATRTSQIPRNLHRRRPRRVRCLRKHSIPCHQIWRSMACERTLVAGPCHGSSHRKHRIRLHHLNDLRTAIPPCP